MYRALPKHVTSFPLLTFFVPYAAVRVRLSIKRGTYGSLDLEKRFETLQRSRKNLRAVKLSQKFEISWRVIEDFMNNMLSKSIKWYSDQNEAQMAKLLAMRQVRQLVTERMMLCCKTKLHTVLKPKPPV